LSKKDDSEVTVTTNDNKKTNVESTQPSNDVPAETSNEIEKTSRIAKSSDGKYDFGFGENNDVSTDVTTPETPSIEEIVDEEITDKTVMNRYLQKSYNMKYSFSQTSKEFENKHSMILCVYMIYFPKIEIFSLVLYLRKIMKKFLTL